MVLPQAQALQAAQRAWKPFEEVRSPSIEGFQPLIEGYYRLKARREQEGFFFDCDQDEFPTFAPAQLAGLLPSGEAFYFRCRHDTCSLRIATPDGDPIGHPVWQGAISRWHGEDAGMLST